MKKYSFLCIAAIAAMIGSSCSNDDSGNQGTMDGDGKVAVGFKSVVDKSTKGTPTPSGNLTQDFWVYAYYDREGDNPSTNLKPDFMFNQKVIYAASGFSYSPVKYWPETGDVNFYAYTPNTAGHLTITKPANADATGYPEFDYAVDNTITAQEDLLVAKAEDMDGLSQSVNFAFDHALTKVGFVARTAGNYASQGVTITITDVSVNNVYSKGTFHYDTYVNNIDTASWWTYPMIDTPVSYALTLPENGIVVGYYENDHTYIQVNPSNQFLLVMPQRFRAGSLATLQITYTVDYEDATPTQSFTKTIPLIGTVAWTPMTHVNYVLTVSLNMVTFTAIVNDWNQTNQIITILPEGDGE